MLEQFQSVLNSLNPPSHTNVGEAYLLHQSLAAYYFLRAKSTLYVHHCQSPGLKEWWEDAQKAIEARIAQLEGQMERLNIPRPASIPIRTDLSDQFMALDGLAMVQGMLMTDVISMQATTHPTLTAMQRQMFDSTLSFGARLHGVCETEGWNVPVPTYQAAVESH